MLWINCVSPSLMLQLDPSKGTGVGVHLLPNAFVTLVDILGDLHPLTF